MTTQHIKILRKTMLTTDVLLLTCEKPESFIYQAGQFVQFYIPHEEKKVKRSYSIASIPDDITLAFCIKLVPNGVASEYIKKLSEGDTIEITSALGRFTLPSDENKPIFGIATGVGIAPIYGLLHEAKKRGRNTSLIFGVRHEDDIFWKQELALCCPTFLLTLSKPTESWKGLQGRVTEHMASRINPTADYYICGNIEMVQDIKHILFEYAIPPEQIHFEIFDT